MIEYIRRDNAIDEIKNANPGVVEEWGGTTLFGYTIDQIKFALNHVPAETDVVQVVHGEWILRHEGLGHYWECSVCHTNPCIYVTEHTKFCPNCGARMDAE